MIRVEIKSLASQIQPLDAEESEHIAFVEQWIDSGAGIFRLESPTAPDPHLVSYFLLIDQGEKKLLLVKHRKANLWLPSGGHVELGEHPKETVSRELLEELGVQADFISEKPFFLTVTKTTGDKDQHTDVSFWYILRASIATQFQFDEREFHDISWFRPSEIPMDQTDPHMSRLIQKLTLQNILSL